LKHSDFPIENRKNPQNMANLKEYLLRYKNKPSWEKFADFHLIVYLSKIIDIEV